MEATINNRGDLMVQARHVSSGGVLPELPPFNTLTFIDPKGYEVVRVLGVDEALANRIRAELNELFPPAVSAAKLGCEPRAFPPFNIAPIHA